MKKMHMKTIGGWNYLRFGGQGWEGRKTNEFVWEHLELMRNHWGNSRGCHHWWRESENSKAIKLLLRSEDRWGRVSPRFLYIRLPSPISLQPYISFVLCTIFLSGIALSFILGLLTLIKVKILPLFKATPKQNSSFLFASVVLMSSEKS